MGSDAEIENRYAKSSFGRVLDVGGKSIVPGLVDAHTHPVWAGDRVHEFAMKVRKKITMFSAKEKWRHFPLGLRCELAYF